MLAKLALSGVGAGAPTYVDDVFSAFTYTGTGIVQNIATNINLSSGDPDLNKVTFIAELQGGIKVNRVTGSVLSGSGGNSNAAASYAKFDSALYIISPSVIFDSVTASYALGIPQPNFNQPWCIEFYYAGGSSNGSGVDIGSSTVYPINVGNGTNNLQISIDNFDGSSTLNLNLSGSIGVINPSVSIPQGIAGFKVNYDGSMIRVYRNNTLYMSTECGGWATQPNVGATCVLSLSAGTGDTTTARGRASLHSVRYTFGSSREGQLIYTQQPPSVLDSGEGLVWIKGRNLVSNHCLIDTKQGAAMTLASNLVDASLNDPTSLTRFTNTGYLLSTTNSINQSAVNYVSWSFRKAPKFFDVVTYTGDGNLSRAINHSLGVAPGMMIVKSLMTNGGNEGWQTYHRSLGPGFRLYLNTPAASDSIAAAAHTWGLNGITPTDSTFYVGDANNGNPGPAYNSTTNQTGVTYVAYLFAHDAAANGLVQCGSYTGASNLEVTLGWEPQFLILKSTSLTTDWNIIDTTRLHTSAGEIAVLKPNLSNAEATETQVGPTATGFKFSGIGSGYNNAGSSYIYLAIRRPNKPPTLGTQVYSAVLRTGTGAAAPVTGVGFAPDLAFSKARNNALSTDWRDRLRGHLMAMESSGAGAELDTTGTGRGFDGFSMDGVNLFTDSGRATWNANTTLYINHFFKRAPSVFDVVCYTGDGTLGRQVPHSLGVVPELLISKRRNATGIWGVSYGTSLPTSLSMALETTAASGTANGLATRFSTSTTFYAESGANTSAGTYVAYLFATKVGISKVGTYIGTDSALTINCGFTTGARFVMVKRTNSTGDWYVWDSTRGIVALEDPHTSLNTTAAEVTSNDSIDPHATGFIVNQLPATNININGGNYLYLAFA